MAIHHPIATAVLGGVLGIGGAVLAQSGAGPGATGTQGAQQQGSTGMQGAMSAAGTGGPCYAPGYTALSGSGGYVGYGYGPAFGAGMGPTGAAASTGAPVPQYWIADTSVFINSARGAAKALQLEQSINVSAPNVLGNQAQFVLATIGRALTSLGALSQNAQATKPSAIASIRSVVGELVAAQAQASQVLDAASSGVFGPAYNVTAQSAATHLAAAERGMLNVADAYGARLFALGPTGGGGGGRAGAAAAPAADIIR